MTRRPGCNGGHNVKTERNAAVVAFYETHSVHECAKRFALSTGTVSTILHREGVQMRQQGQRLGPDGPQRREVVRRLMPPVRATPEDPHPFNLRFRTVAEIVADQNANVAARGARKYGMAAGVPAKTVPTARTGAVNQGGGKAGRMV